MVTYTEKEREAIEEQRAKMIPEQLETLLDRGQRIADAKAVPPAKVARYSRPGLDKVLATLKAWVEDAEGYADNDVSENRYDMLQDRRDSLQEAVDALEGIE